MERINLTLPDFVFFDGNTPQGNTLEGREVVFHVRSATVIEMFDDGTVKVDEDTCFFRYNYTNLLGMVEPKIAVVHYCATLDLKDGDSFDHFKKEVIKPAILWYLKDIACMDNEIMIELKPKKLDT